MVHLEQPVRMSSPTRSVFLLELVSESPRLPPSSSPSSTVRRAGTNPSASKRSTSTGSVRPCSLLSGLGTFLSTLSASWLAGETE